MVLCLEPVSSGPVSLPSCRLPSQPYARANPPASAVEPVPASTGTVHGVSMRRLQSGREGEISKHAKFRARACRMSSASGGAESIESASNGRCSAGSRFQVQVLARLQHTLMERMDPHAYRSRLAIGTKNSMWWRIEPSTIASKSAIGHPYPPNLSVKNFTVIVFFDFADDFPASFALAARHTLCRDV